MIALGAGYEFGPAFEGPVGMIGGGPFGFEPYEWTDDTSMAIALAEALASTSPSSLPQIVTDEVLEKAFNRWCEWSVISKDVGAQTRSVLGAAKRKSRSSNMEYISLEVALEASKSHHDRYGRSAGNGSLMRTAPLALAFLRYPHPHPKAEEEEAALMRAAGAVSALTHWDRDAREACGIWCIAIRHVVLTGTLDIRRALNRPSLFSEGVSEGHDDGEVSKRVELWNERLNAAESSLPNHFVKNGWVVQALQGAWSAIYHSVPASLFSHPSLAPPESAPSFPHPFIRTLETAIRGGNDTDTVAAIAGSLVGALYGLGSREDVGEALPVEWRDNLHGWPGVGVVELEKLVLDIITGYANEKGA